MSVMESEASHLPLRLFLGWSIIGGSAYSKKTLNINFVTRADQLLQKQVECLWKLDMVPNSDDSKPGMSRNDRYALDLLNNSKKQLNGHYQVKLLWKPGCPKFNSNFKQAMFRFSNAVHGNDARIREQRLC